MCLIRPYTADETFWYDKKFAAADTDALTAHSAMIAEDDAVGHPKDMAHDYAKFTADLVGKTVRIRFYTGGRTTKFGSGRQIREFTGVPVGFVGGTSCKQLPTLLFPNFTFSCHEMQATELTIID